MDQANKNDHEYSYHVSLRYERRHTNFGCMYVHWFGSYNGQEGKKFQVPWFWSSWSLLQLVVRESVENAAAACCWRIGGWIEGGGGRGEGGGGEGFLWRRRTDWINGGECGDVLSAAAALGWSKKKRTRSTRERTCGYGISVIWNSFNCSFFFMLHPSCFMLLRMLNVNVNTSNPHFWINPL